MFRDLVRNRLENALESIKIIQERFNSIKKADDFMNTTDGATKLDAISMRLQTIGEALKKIDSLYSNYLTHYKAVEWDKIIKMRDLISHHYESVNPVVIYDVCINHLPVLKSTISQMLKELNK